MVEVLTAIVEQMVTVNGNSFRAYPLLKVMNGWFNDTQNSPMIEAECQKIIDI